MALRGTLTHRKTRRLAKMLGISPVFALGILEALWHVTAEQTPDGAIGKLSNLDISEEMFYDGDHDQLVDALIESGWIDRSETHRLVIHDWSVSADTSVHTFLAKRTMLFCDGVRPRLSDSTLSGQTKSRIQAEYNEKYGHVTDSNPQHVGQASDESQTNPVPDPEPEPEPKPDGKEGDAHAQTSWSRPPTKLEVINEFTIRGVEDATSQAELFWNNYDSKGWTVGGSKITNWKSRIPIWLNQGPPKGRASPEPIQAPKESLEAAAIRRHERAMRP